MERAVTGASPAEREDLEAWTARHFLRLSRALFAPTQRPEHFAAFDLDPRQVGRELWAQGRDRRQPSAADTIFSTAAKAVQRAGLISARTAYAYDGFL